MGQANLLEDQLMMQRVTRDNDYRAFEMLFHRYYNQLCRYALTLTQVREAAEEIAADVFLRIWRNRETLVIKSSVHAYLIAAARNQSIDYLRKVIRERGRNEEIDRDFDSEYATPDQVVVGKESDKIIESAIDALPPQGKLIFRMSRDKGMTYVEIADTLGLSIKTVETHMGRSLKFLRSSLREAQVLA
ncbi:MAG: RNA polymerase sigma-70 factor [Saprospiraceae bacterium]|nr:RNA polymerase sigma-70 factor [Saprospiraceae bacterium]